MPDNLHGEKIDPELPEALRPTSIVLSFYHDDTRYGQYGTSFYAEMHGI